MSSECGVVDSQRVKCSVKRDKNYNRHFKRFHVKVNCDECPEEEPFVDRAALEIHRKSHSFEQFCPKPWCGASAYSKSNLEKHIQQCTFSDARIKCSLCATDFSLLRGYKKHLKNQHKKTQLDASEIIKRERASHLKPTPACKSEDEVSHQPQAKRLKLESDESLNLYTIPTPSSTTDRQMLKYGKLSILYGYGIRGPRVAHMRLTKENLHSDTKRSTISAWASDDRIPTGCGALRADFSQSKDKHDDEFIEKGHVQSALFMSIDEETSEGIQYLATVLPQKKHMNRETWDRKDRHIKWLLEHKHDIIDSFAGGLYVEDLGKIGRLPLASHFFDLLICHLPNGQVDLEILAIPHEIHDPGIGLSNFHVTYEELLDMDRENFLPRFQFNNIRKVNGKDVAK